MLNTEIYDRYANLLVLENYKSACVHMDDNRMLSTVDKFLKLVEFMQSKGFDLCACNGKKGLHFKRNGYRLDTLHTKCHHDTLSYNDKLRNERYCKSKSLKRHYRRHDIFYGHISTEY